MFDRIAYGPRRGARSLRRGWRSARRTGSPSCGWVETLEARLLLSSTAAEVFTPQQLSVDGSAWDASRLLVRVDPQTGPAAAGLEHLHAALSRGPAPQAFPAFDGLQVVHLAEGVSVIDALAAYRSHPAVLYAEPDYHVQLLTAPNDPQFGSLWGLNNTGQTGGTPGADISALEAWGLATGSGSVIVAVIDTGVDYTHPDLAANMWVNPGEIPGDGIDNNGSGYIDDVHGYDFYNRDGDPMDDHNHGTHVAGTIGAVGNNGLGVTGVNWNVQIMALKFLGADGSGSISHAIEALNYAVANGAVVSNNSWGFSGQFSQALYDAIAAARDAGHIFVAAAGNGDIFGIGQNNDSTPFWPASFDLDNIVAVAATDHNDQLAIFSNYGATSVDLAAPGVNILSTIRGGSYGTSSGTSMAAPHVTGVLALLADQHPDWTYRELIDAVLDTVDPVPNLEGKTVTGGRLNAYEALLAGVTGPRVLFHSPVVTSWPVSSLRVRFSKVIDAATFTLEDVVSFAGPEGPLAVTAIEPVADSGGREFDLFFAEQSAFGTYELVFGPDILDLDGEPMDQDADRISGEPFDDRYIAVFVIEPFAASFDFGTASSAVEPGYLRVTPADAYTAAAGFGWSSGSVLSANRSSGTPLTRDLNFSPDATFVVDVPDGQYDVTVIMGDTGGFAHDLMAVFLEDVHRATLSTAAGEIVVNTWPVSVADGQLTLRLVDLGGSDPNAVINGLLVQATGPDVTGPRVVATDPAGSVSGIVDRVVLDFSEAIADGTFTLDDVVSLTGPDGPIVPTAVNRLAPSRYEVVFPPQQALGAYTLVIGPDILDAAGNPMDQDGDGINGEPVDDRFTLTFVIEPLTAFFDFGTSSSPVEPGYVRITPADTYSVATGYGWQSGSVLAANRSSGTALARDLNFSPDMTFAVAAAAEGLYDVTLVMGDTGGFAHDLMAVFLEGAHVATLSTAAGQVVTNTYRVSVTDGELTLRLVDLGGSDANAVINGLEVRYIGIDTEGPRVIASDPAGSVVSSVDRITLWFSEPIREGTFTLDDVVSLTGPNGPIAPTAVNKLSGNEYEVVFPRQFATGEYRLTIGPDIEDLAGNRMDQDQDGVPGLAPDDQFTARFTLESFLARFDFGTASSPVADGFVGIAPASVYSAQAGYGWLSGTVSAADRTSGTALTRDLNFTQIATFVVDVPDGTYQVTITMGDTGAFGHDLMGVFLEGVHVDTVTTAPREVVTRSYVTGVADGQLTLLLHDLGGSDKNVVINGLEVELMEPTAGAANVIEPLSESSSSALPERADGIRGARAAAPIESLVLEFAARRWSDPMVAADSAGLRALEGTAVARTSSLNLPPRASPGRIDNPSQVGERSQSAHGADDHATADHVFRSPQLLNLLWDELASLTG